MTSGEGRAPYGRADGNREEWPDDRLLERRAPYGRADGNDWAALDYDAVYRRAPYGRADGNVCCRPIWTQGAVSRPVRARGLKQGAYQATMPYWQRSRPVRARGLKPCRPVSNSAFLRSRPVRARGLKLPPERPSRGSGTRRAPYGRADGNGCGSQAYQRVRVAPRTGARIETANHPLPL